MTVPDAAVVATANAVTAAADRRAAAHNRTAAEDRPASIATTANHYAATINDGLRSGRRSDRGHMPHERTSVRPIEINRQRHQDGHDWQQVYLEHVETSLI